MNIGAILSAFASETSFDLPSVVQLSGEARPHVLTQLNRWAGAGKLIPLRRGMYTIAEPYRHSAVNPAELANSLYRPSYLSGLWALGFYGLIPEKVVTYTSVSTRVTRKFSNAFGTFTYQNVKQSAFFGYGSATMQGRKIMLAHPEKALLDLWHLNSGAWSVDRLREMRFQNLETVNLKTLAAYAERFESPRLVRAVAAWETMCRDFIQQDAEGTVEL